ncbi:hypothetical protein [Aquabacterium sp.]|uniref:hypothetical protein n=1 Tax=Aquabacterium sp. TaxID=1872578 RepID=UPI0025C2895F|nr:hypothetical protein [Aquabacterium sp.]
MLSRTHRSLRTPLALSGALTLSMAMCLSMLSPWSAHAAAAPFTGPDLSGVYDCTGQDHHEGPYTATATLQLVPAQSTGRFGAYLFTLDVPGYGSYPGHASVRGTDAAIYFALSDPSTKDFGTGIASFKKNAKGRWTFAKHYFEPEFKGGNFGDEHCVQR